MDRNGPPDTFRDWGDRQVFVFPYRHYPLVPKVARVLMGIGTLITVVSLGRFLLSGANRGVWDLANLVFWMIPGVCMISVGLWLYFGKAVIEIDRTHGQLRLRGARLYDGKPRVALQDIRAVEIQSRWDEELHASVDRPQDMILASRAIPRSTAAHILLQWVRARPVIVTLRGAYNTILARFELPPPVTTVRAFAERVAAMLNATVIERAFVSSADEPSTDMETRWDTAVERLRRELASREGLKMHMEGEHLVVEIRPLGLQGIALTFTLVGIVSIVVLTWIGFQVLQTPRHPLQLLVLTVFLIIPAVFLGLGISWARQRMVLKIAPDYLEVRARGGFSKTRFMLLRGHIRNVFLAERGEVNQQPLYVLAIQERGRNKPRYVGHPRLYRERACLEALADLIRIRLLA